MDAGTAALWQPLVTAHPFQITLQCVNVIHGMGAGGSRAVMQDIPRTE